MTDPGDSPTRKLTTDPPRPPGTPDVDDLVGDPAADRTGSRDGRGTDEGGDAVTGDDAVETVEPPD